jgi:hypothetical protein
MWVLPAVSPIQSSIPFGVVLVNAKWDASGLHIPRLSLGFCGRSNLTSAPSGILRNVIEELNVVLCRPLVLGLMRMPAMRNMGCASSAIGG